MFSYLIKDGPLVVYPSVFLIMRAFVFSWLCHGYLFFFPLEILARASRPPPPPPPPPVYPRLSTNNSDSNSNQPACSSAIAKQQRNNLVWTRKMSRLVGHVCQLLLLLPRKVEREEPRQIFFCDSLSSVGVAGGRGWSLFGELCNNRGLSI